MPYIKGVWIDEVLAGSARYDILENGGGAFKATMQINLITSVTQAGTSVNAARMNNIESGIENADQTPGFLFGLNISNNAADATNDIDIAPGKCRDASDSMNIALTSILTKRLDAAWVVGSSNGGLDHGTIANATYHKHLIKRSDTGVVDAIYSLSHDRQETVTVTIASPGVVTWLGKDGIGHGLVTGSTFKFSTTGALPTGITAGTIYYVIATGLTSTTFQFSASAGGAAINTSGTQSGIHTGIALPLLPANYNGWRRISSVIRVGGAIKPFIQDGDKFIWKVPTSDVNAVNPGTAAVTRTLTVPLGIRVEAILSISGYGADAAGTPGAIFISDLSITDTAPSVTAAANAVTYSTATGALQTGSVAEVFTNTNGQVRSRIQISTANTTLFVLTLGWIDTRGRLA